MTVNYKLPLWFSHHFPGGFTKVMLYFEVMLLQSSLPCRVYLTGITVPSVRRHWVPMSLAFPRKISKYVNNFIHDHPI